MILQRLTEHYDRLADQQTGDLPIFGRSIQKVSFCVVLEPDGTLSDIQDERQLEGKTIRPRNLIVPGQAKPTGSGINPCFLWDNAEYMLGWTSSSDRVERATKAFTAFRDLHLSLEAQIDHPAFYAVCSFLRSWSPERAATWAEKLADYGMNFGVFRIAGEKYVHEIVQAPIGRDEDETIAQAMCLVTGDHATPARLHEPKIKGVANAQSAGALLVSFNGSAFTSYGRDQSFNAPVSVSTTFKYTNALNYLLSQRDHRIGLGDATVVFWADRQDNTADIFSAIFSGLPDDATLVAEDKIRVKQARLLLQQMRSGTMEQPPPETSASTRFFILGLSPNASRLSVRLWVEEDARTLQQRLARHIQDLALAGGRDDRTPSLRQIVNATGRAEYDAKGRLKSYDTKLVSPQLAGDLARSVLTGAAYPWSLLSTMIRRIRSDGEISFPRVSAIKAVLVRNSRLTAKSLEIPMELNDQETDIAYRCGRLFAVLEKAQADSLGGELNATIKDRYFAAASATPSLVFPRIFRLNGYHLAKLSTGTKIYYERLIAGIMTAPFRFPNQLRLSEQGQFVVGYFQQRQALYTRKDKTSGTELPSE